MIPSLKLPLLLIISFLVLQSAGDSMTLSQTNIVTWDQIADDLNNGNGLREHNSIFDPVNNQILAYGGENVGNSPNDNVYSIAPSGVSIREGGFATSR